MLLSLMKQGESFRKLFIWYPGDPSSGRIPWFSLRGSLLEQPLKLPHTWNPTLSVNGRIAREMTLNNLRSKVAVVSQRSPSAEACQDSDWTEGVDVGQSHGRLFTVFVDWNWRERNVVIRAKREMHTWMLRWRLRASHTLTSTDADAEGGLWGNISEWVRATLKVLFCQKHLPVTSFKRTEQCYVIYRRVNVCYETGVTNDEPLGSR